MKTKLLKKLRKGIRLHYNKNTGDYYIYDSFYGDIYTVAESEKMFLLSLTTIDWRDKKARLRLAKYRYREAVLWRARNIYLPIRINNNSWWSKLFAYCG